MLFWLVIYRLFSPVSMLHSHVAFGFRLQATKLVDDIGLYDHVQPNTKTSQTRFEIMVLESPAETDARAFC